MSADIMIGLKCDPSELTAGMTESRQQIQNTTTVIVQQQNAWATLGSAAISAAASLANTGANVVMGLKRMQHEMTEFVVTTALASAAFIGLVSPSKAATIGIAAGTAGLIYHHQWLLKVVGLTVPGMAQIAGAVGLAMTAYKAATFVIDDVAASFRGSIDGARDTILEYNRLHGASGRLSASMSELGKSITTPFRDGAAAVYNYVASFSPLPMLAGLAASAMDGVSSAATAVSSGLQSATITATTTAFILATGASNEASASFYEQGQQLAQLSAQTTAFIAKQEAARSSFQSLKAMQEQSTEAASNAAAIAQISSTMTVEGIDEQVAALRAKATETIMAGEADKAWEAQTKALFDALARQRQGLIDGTIVDKEAEAAKLALAKATEDAAKAAGAAAEKELAHQLQGQQKIESLRDQIDLLNGSATNADIAMRQMLRQNFSGEQAEEVGKLTEELDRLKAAEKETGETKEGKKRGGSKELGDVAAVGQGSSAALSAIYAASRNNTPERHLKIAEQTLAESKKQNQKLDKLAATGPSTIGMAIG